MSLALWRSRFFHILSAAALFLADVGSKQLALRFGGSVSFNGGISFSLLGGAPSWVTTAIGGAALAAIAAAYIFAPGGAFSMRLPLAIAAAGAAGNLSDRILYGYVIDWLAISLPFVGELNINAADIWLVIGGGLAALSLLLSRIELQERA